MKRWLFPLLLGLTLGVSAPARAGEVVVAAASDLRLVMDELAQEFPAPANVHLSFTYGSSGKFFAQIVNGAPFEAFFSANSEYPRQLEAQGFVVPGSRFDYGIGRLVLWAPAGSKVPVEKGLAALGDASLERLAIANPDHAPYGQAAVAALKQAHLYDALASRLVMGENISQTAQFVAGGAAQAGLIALSLTHAPGLEHGRYWLVPQSLYPPIIQEAVILRSSPHQAALQEFFGFVRGPKGQAILARNGFRDPTP